MSDDAKSIVDGIDAAPERTWPYTVKLKYPVEFGKQLIDEITFQRGTMGAIEGMKVDSVPDASQLMLIASRLCGKPVAALKLLDPEDGAEVVEIAASFFARCLGAGRTR